MKTKRELLLGIAAASVAPAALAQTQLRPGQPPTNIDEAQVRSYTLPDPLVTEDGRPVTSVEMWRQVRRPEIQNLLEQHMEGVTLEGDFEPRYEIVDPGTPAFDGAAKRVQARIHFEDEPYDQGIRVLLYTPANATGPVPTLLYFGFSPPVLFVEDEGLDEGMAWYIGQDRRVPDREARLIGNVDLAFFVKRGYGIAYVYCADIEPDHDSGRFRGLRNLWGPQPETRAPDDWGSVGVWAWGLSRVLDYLKTRPEVDGEQVAVTGASRLGKTAIWAGAQDERFAVVIPLISGEGGAAISRRNYGETIADLTNPDRYDYWFAPRYDDYSFDVDALPVDGHFLVSMVAPRPILLVTGSTDTWSDPKGEWVSAVAAGPVYALHGKKTVGAGEFPEPEVRILQDMGWFMHEGEHTTLPQDLIAMADFMDMHFTRPA